MKQKDGKELNITLLAERYKSHVATKDLALEFNISQSYVAHALRRSGYSLIIRPRGPKISVEGLRAPRKLLCGCGAPRVFGNRRAKCSDCLRRMISANNLRYRQQHGSRVSVQAVPGFSFWPFVRSAPAESLESRINTVVSRYIPEHVRADVCQELALLAIEEPDSDLSQLLVVARKRVMTVQYPWHERASFSFPEGQARLIG